MTAAKKTTPAGKSLSSILGRDDDSNEETKKNESSNVASQNDEKNDKDNKDNNEKTDSRNDDSDVSDDDLAESEPDDENSDGSHGVVVTKPEPGIDNQAGKETQNDGDSFVNPDGVTNRGAENLMNKTPADMSAETPQESANRYGISDEIPDDVHNNPDVRATRDNRDYQIPGGTHLHPDVARDNYNRSVGGRPSESGQVTMTTTQNVYAAEAPLDDKGIANKPLKDLAD